jgi:TldD protein
MKTKALYLSLLFLTLIAFPIKPIYCEDVLLGVLKEELNREFSQYSSHDTSVYYLEYRVDEIKTTNISCSFGSLINNDNDSIRVLSVITRVGDYNLDNTHEIKDLGNSYQPLIISIPIENNPRAIKLLLWKASQYSYRDAINSYNQVLTALSRSQDNTGVPDFSKEQPAVYYEAPVNINITNKDLWINRLKNYTGQFTADENIIRADAHLNLYCIRKYFVNSEGTSIAQNLSYAQLQIVVSGKSDKGNTPLVLSYFAFTPEELPSDSLVRKDLANLYDTQKGLEKASLAEPFAGPAILSPAASAVFFHEIFGHRIEGHRLKSSFDSHTFKSQVDNKVLPKYVSIYSDPTMSRWENNDLYGYFKYDDQGVPAQKVEVVKEGILKNFLMSRNPIVGFLHSNGHGRSQIGKMPVSRQSNLIVETKKSYTEKELRKKLIAECKKQKKEYGLYFKEVIGGFTQTSRYSPNVFNVTPVVVYKIYTDGRPDELVKGVDFIGTPLAIFSEIGAMGNQPGIFTGYCGAESGSIPVTAIAPPLFINKIETQKKPDSSSPSPILSRPKK